MRTMKANRIKESLGDRVFSIGIGILIGLLLLITLYSLYFVIIASISDPLAVFSGEVYLWPKEITVYAYSLVWQNEDIWVGYRNTVLYTIVGTAVNISVTMTGAYALSRKKMFGRNVIMFIITFTMFFNGGLIPTYLQVRNMGLYNTFWIMILINAVGVYNLIVARTFMSNTIDEQLYEAAYIDGCSDARAFFNIVLPLSAPILAVLILFYGVGHWNQYFNALIYLQDRSRIPLQLVLREILLANITTSMTEQMELVEEDISKYLVSESLKYAVIVVSSIPMLVLYPFLQKFFVKGIMVGAIKG